MPSAGEPGGAASLPSNRSRTSPSHPATCGQLRLFRRVMVQQVRYAAWVGDGCYHHRSPATREADQQTADPVSSPADQQRMRPLVLLTLSWPWKPPALPSLT
ncbi:hypothetical protein IAQ61_004355 [Plenodomus lingam]|uniref:uncharacterized protein n=1 Tax=Leptosphaeria maculans TaxID=5022 RepID=UPI00331CA2C0|nr:hypothetical protein IAQ61_004355 [Plenodomus lingam]